MDRIRTNAALIGLRTGVPAGRPFGGRSVPTAS